MTQLRIALIGRSGSGKDYVASYLSRQFHVCRAAYADALKEDFGEALLRAIGAEMPAAGTIGWMDEQKRRPEVRAYLQAAGEAVVALAGEDYWAERAKREQYGPALGNPNIDVVVITDMRKLPEAAHARRDGFHLVRVVRTDGQAGPGITAATALHRSEIEMDTIKADWMLTNDGTPGFAQTIEHLLSAIWELEETRQLAGWTLNELGHLVHEACPGVAYTRVL